MAGLAGPAFFYIFIMSKIFFITQKKLSKNPMEQKQNPFYKQELKLFVKNNWGKPKEYILQIGNPIINPQAEAHLRYQTPQVPIKYSNTSTPTDEDIIYAKKRVLFRRAIHDFSIAFWTYSPIIFSFIIGLFLIRFQLKTNTSSVLTFTIAQGFFFIGFIPIAHIKDIMWLKVLSILLPSVLGFCCGIAGVDYTWKTDKQLLSKYEYAKLNNGTIFVINNKEKGTDDLYLEKNIYFDSTKMNVFMNIPLNGYGVERTSRYISIEQKNEIK